MAKEHIIPNLRRSLKEAPKHFTQAICSEKSRYKTKIIKSYLKAKTDDQARIYVHATITRTCAHKSQAPGLARMCVPYSAHTCVQTLSECRQGLDLARTCVHTPLREKLQFFSSFSLH